MAIDAPSISNAPGIRGSPAARLQGQVRKLTADLEVERARSAQIGQAAARDERERIIEALHDTICQSLTGLCLEAAVLYKGFKEKGADEAGELKVLYETLRHTVGELHDVIHGLQEETRDTATAILQRSEEIRRSFVSSSTA